MSEEMKIILINITPYILIFICLLKTPDANEKDSGKEGWMQKILVMFSALLCLLIFGSAYIMFKAASDSYKGNEKLTIEEQKVSEIKGLIKKKLQEDIISRKCEVFLSEHKNDNIPKFICNKYIKDNLNKSLSYEVSAGTKVTVLVKDGFIYKYTESGIKYSKLISRVLRYSVLSLDSSIRNSLDENIKHPKQGFTYLDMFNEINREMNLCERYDYFTDIVDCNITFKVVPDSELNEGKIYKVE